MKAPRTHPSTEAEKVYAREYYQRNKERMLGLTHEYQARHRTEIHRNNRTPHRRATRFKSQNPDCTSSVEEVETIYSASVNMLTGKRGDVGLGRDGLVLDHIHNGPVVGLIPNWLNKVCERLNGNTGSVLQYMEHRNATQGPTRTL